jgi:hypothetical protein
MAPPKKAEATTARVIRSDRSTNVTARDLLELLGRHPLILAGLFVLLPAAVILTSALHGPKGGVRPPWSYAYAVLVYLACIPGVGAAVVTGYTLFFTRENLLDKDLLVHLAPIVSMVVTLVLIRKRVAFDEIPGFERLSGLLTLIAVTFVILLLVRKTFIGIVFGASLVSLLALAAILFGLLSWGARAVRGSNRSGRST